LGSDAKQCTAESGSAEGGRDEQSGNEREAVDGNAQRLRRQGDGDIRTTPMKGDMTDDLAIVLGGRRSRELASPTDYRIVRT
jgi:hypothetical protein